MTQYSLFGAAAARPAVEDLDGLLLAGAQWVRSGAAARLSVVVAERWRADALHAAFVERGVAAAEPDGVVEATAGFAARTAFTDTLAASAARWTHGSRQGLPPDFALTAGSLRLWAIAAGRPDDVGYLLATPGADEPTHRTAGAHLSRLGVAAVALSRRGGSGAARLAGDLGAAAAPAGRTARPRPGRRGRVLAALAGAAARRHRARGGFVRRSLKLGCAVALDSSCTVRGGWRVPIPLSSDQRRDGATWQRRAPVRAPNW